MTDLTEIDNYKRTSEKLFASVGIQPQSKFIATDGPVKNVHIFLTARVAGLRTRSTIAAWIYKATE